MRKGLKCLLSVLFVCILSSQLFAVDGTITYVKGKVEVKRDGNWISLKVGDKVSQSEVINTGFQSEAKVKLMESVLYLGPVTRVTLDQLSTDSDRDKVNVYLSSGTVRSKVNRTDNKRVNYTVRTPIAVASVRGTDVATTAGGDVITYSGLVSYSTYQDLGLSQDDLIVNDEDAKDKDKKKDKDSENSGDASGDTAVEGNEGTSAGGKLDGVDSKDNVADQTSRQKSQRELEMENSNNVPNKIMVPAGHGVNYDTASSFGGASANVAGNAMNIIQSVSTESSKSNVSKGGAKSPSAAINGAIAGEKTESPKTGSINVQITEPTTGNVSVEVVIPQ